VSKSALDWLTITKDEGQVGWNKFYRAYTGQPISQPKRFFDAVDRLGHAVVFEAVVAASLRTLDGDPMNYIMAIALAKFNDEIGEIDSASRYKFNIDRAKQRVENQNEELESKFNKAREISRARTR